MSDKTLVLYHDDCMDGLMAGWCIYQSIRLQRDANKENFKFVAFDYQRTQLDKVTRDFSHLIFVDCCPTPGKVRHLLMDNPSIKTIKILDHHKTAHCDWLPRMRWTSSRLRTHTVSSAEGPAIKEAHLQVGSVEVDGCAITMHYATELSGVELAFYEYLLPHMESPRYSTPWWVRYLSDRDRWVFELPESKAVNLGLWLLFGGQDFEIISDIFDIWKMRGAHCGNMDAFSHNPPRPTLRQHVHTLGTNAQLTMERLAQDIAARATPFFFEGHQALAVSAPRALRSEVGALLAQRAPVALVWDQHPNGSINVSLRSNREQNGPDVAAIAQVFSGGGHHHASGFVCALSDLLAILGSHSST